MEFHDFATTHDVARRLGMTDEPATRFYHQMQGVAIQAHRRRIAGTASDYNRYQSDLNWCDAGRPYYKLWPAVIPLLAGVGIEVPVEYLRAPFNSFLVRFPVQDNPLRISDQHAVKAVLVNDGLNDKDERRIFLWLDVGEFDAAGLPVLTNAWPTNWLPSGFLSSAELEAERSTESFAKKKEAEARRREKAQAEYVEDFYEGVLAFLAFHPKHADLADRLARAVTDHATPVGSGTVACTKRIPVEQRAEAAVIAWMRHQTTAYDTLVIPRVKGKRREVRRMLAQRSQELLERYRRGGPAGDDCPLMKALVIEANGR